MCFYSVSAKEMIVCGVGILPQCKLVVLNSTRESNAESQSPLSMRKAMSCTGKMYESWLLVSVFCFVVV